MGKNMFNFCCGIRRKWLLRTAAIKKIQPKYWTIILMQNGRVISPVI
jgi:hypothetical protein